MDSMTTPAFSRAITRKTTGKAPSEFAALTAPFHDLCKAIEFRGERTSDDETVRRVLAALPTLVSVIDNECVAYIEALSDKVDALGRELDDLKLRLR